MKIEIVKALYGHGNNYVDVTESVKSKLNSQRVIIADNNLCGYDPVPHVQKELILDLEVGEKAHFHKVKEGFKFNLDILNYDPDKDSVLIAFYTNNCVDPKILKSSLNALENLRKKTEKFNVFVATSVWEPIPESPFTEFISPMKHAGALNINMQIIDCLSYAYGLNRKFKYVMMAEHDVLYPENYIDDLAHISDHAPVIANKNYIGMCEYGYQNNELFHDPLHQMIFDYQYALYHFSDLIVREMNNRYFLLEPQTSRGTWIYRHSSLPAVHINHSRNYTSHYDCYSKTNMFKEHPYWGNYLDYYPDLEKSNITWPSSV